MGGPTGHVLVTSAVRRGSFVFVVVIHGGPFWAESRPLFARDRPECRRGGMWYLTPFWTRVRVKDTQRVSDQTTRA